MTHSRGSDDHGRSGDVQRDETFGRATMTADGSDRPIGAPRFDVVLRGYDPGGRSTSTSPGSSGSWGACAATSTPPAESWGRPRRVAEPGRPRVPVPRPAGPLGRNDVWELHRPDARDPAVGGGGGRGDPEQGPRRRSGRRRTRRKPACRLPGGGGRRPEQAR